MAKDITDRLLSSPPFLTQPQLPPAGEQFICELSATTLPNIHGNQHLNPDELS